MTDQELQDLRDWVAKEVMGWELLDIAAWKRDMGEEATICPYWKIPDGNWVMLQSDFTPDLPNGQIEDMIDQMMSLNWKLTLHCWPNMDPTAIFRKSDGSYGNVPEVRASDPNRHLAILLAAKAAILEASR